jgi:hypothetical protein
MVRIEKETELRKFAEISKWMSPKAEVWALYKTVSGQFFEVELYYLRSWSNAQQHSRIHTLLSGDGEA